MVGGLILGYHRVADVTEDPYAMCVTPRDFAQQLEVLRRQAQPISLTELVSGLRVGDLPKGAVALTLDDGYADALANVKPLLERYQIPATVFVTSGYLGRAFWWDELERMLFAPARLPARLSLRVNGAAYEWPRDVSTDGGSGDRRQHLLRSLYRWLLPLSPDERQEAMVALRDWAGVEPDDQPRARVLTADEVIELAAGDLVDIGAHTVSHPVLSALPLPQQQSEIEGSKAHLEELLGRPVTSFSYPNGSCSRETRAIVRELRFSCACASDKDVAWRGSDPFYMPRFWVPNWDGDHFSRWLARWL